MNLDRHIIPVPVSFFEDLFAEETGEEYNPHLGYVSTREDARRVGAEELGRVLGVDLFDADGEIVIDLFLSPVYGDWETGDSELGWYVSNEEMYF